MRVGVAGEGRVVGIPKFHCWGKCTMRLMNINSDWLPNASSDLCINLYYLFILRGSFKLHLGGGGGGGGIRLFRLEEYGCKVIWAASLASYYCLLCNHGNCCVCWNHKFVVIANWWKLCNHGNSPICFCIDVTTKANQRKLVNINHNQS